MIKSQTGFTLLELVIAMAVFALLGLGCWQLFDVVVRAERSSSAHEQALRNLQRAVALIERDVLQVQTSIKHPGLSVHPDRLTLRRGNWRNPLGQPRSEVQDVTYSVENGVLWRRSQGLGLADIQAQKVLSGVRDLRWRVYGSETGWRGEWTTDKALPSALDVQFSVGNYEQIRRVLLLPEGE